MKHRIRLILLGVLLAGSTSSLLRAAPPTSPDFDRDVAAIFASRCFDCHNTTEYKGELDLTRRGTAMKGGESGRVIVPGNPDKSLLWKNVSGNKMPPKHPLADAEKHILERWIAAGANWGSDPIDPFRFTTAKRGGYDWWSLQPLRKVDPPTVKPGWGRNPIDAFILAELEQNGLSPSPEADKRTLIRRLTFDLTGLPPTPEQVESFIADAAPDAYEKVVDRLLSSPDYGVRWARHWLDLARFGESNGFERDQLRPNAWRYRDWVVDAFNSDMPYDRFVRMQLAGDVIGTGSPEGIIATGFYVGGAYDIIGDTQQSLPMRAVVRQDQFEDNVSVVSQTFLGLTANCARCHDHKFDPIAQREYYQLASALAGVHHGERDLPVDYVHAEAQKITPTLDKRMAELKSQIDAIEALARARLFGRQIEAPTLPSLKAITDGFRESVLSAVMTDALTDAQRIRRGVLRNELQALRRMETRGRAVKTYANTPITPAVTHLLFRGVPSREGPVVSPGGIASIVGPSADFGLKPDASDADRRVKLAAWITDARNPLFARVIVNRLWQYHFGTGIVDTPNDFGFNGGRPSHPQSLDWLATQIQSDGWSMKKIHRLMVTSAAYRQSSLPRSQGMQRDASNRLLWRMNPRRIEAEALRDAVLQCAAQLNPARGGPGFEDYYTFTQNSTFYEFRDYIGDTFNRRSLYRTWVRSGRSPLLDVFDCPDPSTKAPRRAVTTTPLQALALMNDSFMLRMSDSLADVVKHEAGEDIGRQVSGVYARTVCRAPSDIELEDAIAFVRKHGLAALCRVMFNSSEFVSVD